MKHWWREKWLNSCIRLAWRVEAWANRRIARYVAWYQRELNRPVKVVYPPAN